MKMIFPPVYKVKFKVPLINLHGEYDNHLIYKMISKPFDADRIVSMELVTESFTTKSPEVFCHSIRFKIIAENGKPDYIDWYFPSLSGRDAFYLDILAPTMDSLRGETRAFKVESKVEFKVEPNVPSQHSQEA